MKLKSFYIAFLTVVFLFSCNNNKKNISENTTPKTETMADNSMTSLDWAGTYEGVLPCADCEGIRTVMTINDDNTYVVKEIYQGEKDSVFESKGTFKWDDKGQNIMFSDKTRHSYFVGENTLTHLDADGNKISGDLSDLYVLNKVNDELVGKKWHLVAFKGKDIQLEEAKAEHPFIEFSEDETLSGFTGCNNLRGGYSLADAQKIKFSNLISTKKFCPEMATENEFLSVLTLARAYEFENRALNFYDKEHQLLAQFKIAN